MRTKTALAVAALTAAGALTSMAQVYSVNIVGYINLTLPRGFSMVANQLNATPDNTLATILPNVPENTQAYKFNGTGYDASFFSADNPGWSVPGMALAPGEGAFIYVDPAFAPVGGAPVTFVGEVKLTSSIPVPNGFSIVSSAIPQNDCLDNLGYVARENDQVYMYNGATKAYDAFFWSADNPGWAPSCPTPAIGQSFFLYGDPNFGLARTWNRTFPVGP